MRALVVDAKIRTEDISTYRKFYGSMQGSRSYSFKSPEIECSEGIG